MKVFYYGADQPFSQIIAEDINRRNIAYLFALIQSPTITEIVCVHRTTRSMVFTQLFRKNYSGKVFDLFYAPILPERGFFQFFRPINSWLLKIIYWRHFKLKNEGDKVINWCYWPKGYRDWKYLGTKGKLLFDSDHNILNDPNLPLADIDVRKRLLVEIAGKANYVLSGSRTMLQWFSQFPTCKVILAMNGVMDCKVNEFRKAVNPAHKEIVYCGTLSKWIKRDWLIKLIKDYPKWTFHIIGRDYLTNLSKELKAFENVILHGYLPRKNADNIIEKADVAIALYKKDAHIDVSSMKIFDYLKMGKKVVTNNFHPHLLQDYESLIYCADSYDKFQEYISNDEFLPPKIKIIKSFLRKMTWKKIVNDILLQIED